MQLLKKFLLSSLFVHSLSALAISEPDATAVTEVQDLNPLPLKRSPSAMPGGGSDVSPPGENTDDTAFLPSVSKAHRGDGKGPIKTHIFSASYRMTANDGDTESRFMSGLRLYGGLECETSDASPRVKNIRIAMKKLRNQRGLASDCAQWNGLGSKCTSHKKFRDADIGTCGAHLMVLKCRDLAWAAEEIIYYCSENRNGGIRAGGQWDISAGLLRVIVH